MKYRRKPKAVDAVQWFPIVKIPGVQVYNHPGVKRWIEQPEISPTAGTFVQTGTVVGVYRFTRDCLVHELELNPGDWLIWGGGWDPRVMTDAEFASEYEPA